MSNEPNRRYWMALPDGWRRITLRMVEKQATEGGGNKTTSGAKDRADPAAVAIADIVRTAARGLQPHHATRARGILRASLTEAVTRARAAGGLGLYIPIDGGGEAPIPLGIVVAELVPPHDDRSHNEQLVAFASRGSSTATDVGGQVAVRCVTDRSARTDGAVTALPAARSISYVVGIPDTRRFLSVTGSIGRTESPDSDDLVEAVTELFDAIVRTLRFRRYPEGDGPAADTSRGSGDVGNEGRPET